MAVFLAAKNLLQNKIRTLVAVAGVCFAVALLFMQLGFFATVPLTAMLIYDTLDFDLALVSPHYVMITQAGTFPMPQLQQSLSHPDVARAMPLYVSRQMWRNNVSRSYRAVVTLGVRPSDPVSRDADLASEIPLLSRPDTALVDRLSRRELGPTSRGVVTEVGPRTLQVVGNFRIGPGFESGIIFVGDKTFSQLFGGRPLDNVNVGLIKLRDGADADRVAAELRERLPADARILTRTELSKRETAYWVSSTSTGIIFGSGVIVALLFGVVIIYQVLSMEVTNRLAEYATLKAMGYTDRYLAGVVVQQALVLSVISYVPGFVVALLIYQFGRGVTNLPLFMTWTRAAGVLAATVIMCAASAVLALRILRRADPVDLF